MNNLRVLIFSATFGAGHIRAAEAIIEAMQSRTPTVEISHLDFGEFLNKSLNSVLKNTYLEMIKHTPKLWGTFYYGTAKISPDSMWQRMLNSLGRQEFLKYIYSYQPDLIICTYPTVAGVLAKLRERKILNIPLITIVTDYTVHSQWVHPGVDLYIVGNKFVREGLISRGIDPSTIKVTGIPVSPKFERPLHREDLTRRFGLTPDLPTVLLMGGAFGVLGGIKRICQMLSNSQTPVQSIVVCGHDDKLYKSLDSIISEARNPVHRYGFVRNVEELMSVSDLIVTKAGGLTVSEALTKKLPMIIYKPIPGQEKENAEYIRTIGAGVVANTESEMEQILTSLFNDPQQIETMRQAASQALPERAAEQAVEYMLRIAEDVGLGQKIG
ncbi:glycosyltransferase [Paradesulfitobacterium aromaticivorans]